MTQLLPVTLCTVAAASILTLWLMMRIGAIRTRQKISHGDGNHPLLGRRMRAQLNFVESAPFALLLIGLIEISGKGGHWLAYIAALYILARISHAFGMDSEAPSIFRMFGTIATMLTLLGLSVVAVLVSIGKM